jgi:hypothetical protein
MKKIEMNRKESLLGGDWSWGRAGAGCAMALVSANWSGLTAYATLAFGPLGTAAAVVGSCIVGGVGYGR